MKKFEPDYQIRHGDYGNSSTQAVMREKANGRYVLAEDVEKLEQLNKEMLEVMKKCLPEINFLYHTGIKLWLHSDEPVMQDRQRLLEKLQSLIAKAEEAA